MNKLIELYKKHKTKVLYLVFGVLTTLINVLLYYLFYRVLSIQNILSTCLSWIIAVLFAYITNRIFVFESKATKRLRILKEGLLFFAFRIFTGTLDTLIMYLSVDVLSLNALLWKMLSNIIIIILNYIISKFFIFKNKGTD